MRSDYPCQTQRDKWKGKTFWHRGVLKPTHEHKNPISEWKVYKSQPQVLKSFIHL
jgi:hypothetical protein